MGVINLSPNQLPATLCQHIATTTTDLTELLLQLLHPRLGLLGFLLLHQESLLLVEVVELLTLHELPHRVLDRGQEHVHGDLDSGGRKIRAVDDDVTLGVGANFILSFSSKRTFNFEIFLNEF